MYRLTLLAALGLAGCAAATAPAVAPDHPAAVTASSTEAIVEVAALAPAPQPDLPAPLRPDGRPPGGGMEGMDHDPIEEAPTRMEGQMEGMDHDGTMEVDEAAMSHAAVNHGDDLSGDVNVADSPMAEALDAYLAVQDALASDDPDAAAAHGAHFEVAFGALVEAPPDDDPHLWHARSADVDAVRTAAAALAGAGGSRASPEQALAEARTAFGALSAAFARLVEAAGMPEGYAVERYTCGMVAEAPEGGVWLQRRGDPRNPYFGTAMPTCGTRDRTLPESGGASHDGAGHGGTNHGGH